MTEPDIPWKTLADIDDSPPGPLLFDMLEAGPNLLIAAPGVGKGTTGAWLVCQAIDAGLRPMIYDAERRPREWARRVSGLGGDRSQVVYVAPEELPSDKRGLPLWDIAPTLRVIAAESGSDLLFVDSILPASGVGEDRLRSDPQTPFLYVASLDALGIPSVSFGHPPKGQPEGEAFGSMGWTAAMRMTWSGTRAEGDGHRIRWKPRKRNERGHIPGFLLVVEYADDGRPCTVTREDDEASTRDWLLLALKDEPRGIGDLSDSMSEEFEDFQGADAKDRIRERLSRALRRMAQEGWVEREGPAGGRNVKWRLKWQERKAA